MPKITEMYKAKVLEFLKSHPGSPVEEIRKYYPSAPIRQMEKEDGTIYYKDGRWYAKIGFVHTHLCQWCRQPWECHNEACDLKPVDGYCNQQCYDHKT